MLYSFEEISSTNTWAISNFSTLQHGDIVQAGRQTSGHGRFDRPWLAPRGKALLMSVVLDTRRFMPSRLSWIPLAGALAIHKALCACNLDTGVKWPNDVLADRKKIAGILAEASSDHPFLALGMGLNVNQARDDFPPGLRSHATSVMLETGRSRKLDTIRVLTINHLSHLLRLIEQGETPALLRLWKRHDCFAGSMVHIGMPDGSLYAKYLGVQHDGSLKIRSTDGSVRFLWSGDVTLADK